MSGTVAVLILGPSGLATARRLAPALAAAGHAPVIHALARRVAPAPELVPFDDAMAHAGALFSDGVPIVGVCAAGILVRAVAPHLADKRAEPPVVAVADDGSAVVPLLGAHRGGTAIARTVAQALSVTPAITTAGDARLGVGLDVPPPGHVLENPEDAKAATAALLAGAPAAVDEALGEPFVRLPREGRGAPVVLKSSVRVEDAGHGVLFYRPRRLLLGVGCERGTPPEALRDHALRVLAGAGLAPAAVAAVVSIDLKADEPAVHALADHLGVPARFFPAARLGEEAHRLARPSETVRAEVGVPGVAEAAALAAAGPDGRLLVPKAVGGRVTAAVAEAPRPVDPAAVGRARGRLAIVGTGPGARSWRTAEAEAALREAEEWVGYGPYLDLVADLHGGQPRHAFPLGAEEERVRFALERAGEGRAIALVSSGDPGIYAMAALAFELMDPAGPRPASAAARRAAVTVAPGVSAAQAASARLGAVLGHDFCFVSLSDLLTPWDAIEARLRAAAAGDFVVALYNPRSARRRHQLPAALAILSAARPPDTPVIVATDVGRPPERIAVHHLADVDPEAVDMLSVVIVGASTSRLFHGGDGTPRVYTPRGYAAKVATERTPGETAG